MPTPPGFAAAGERLRPASAERTSESAHFGSEAHGYDLHVLQALRRVGETKAGNFTVLHDALEQEQYGVVVADDQTEFDYVLHENPELKQRRTAT